MGIDTKVQASGKLDRTGRIEKSFVAEQRFTDGMRAVVRRLLRIKCSLSLEKPTLSVGLKGFTHQRWNGPQKAQKGHKKAQELCAFCVLPLCFLCTFPRQDSRLSASRVNASSFIGTLY